MKYKITQDQLDKLAFPFLDREFEGIEKYNVKYFDGIVFKKPDEEYGVLAYKKDGTLLIHYDIIKKINSFFSLNYRDTLSLIKRWAEDRLQIEVINTLQQLSILKTTHQQSVILVHL